MQYCKDKTSTNSLKRWCEAAGVLNGAGMESYSTLRGMDSLPSPRHPAITDALRIFVEIFDACRDVSRCRCQTDAAATQAARAPASGRSRRWARGGASPFPVPRQVSPAVVPRPPGPAESAAVPDVPASRSGPRLQRSRLPMPPVVHPAAAASDAPVRALA